MNYEEYSEQIKVVRWFNQMQLYNKINKNFILSANRATHKLTPAQASRAKAEGMIAGIPDLTLYVVITKYAGLFIEMKKPSLKPKRITSKGGISDIQSKVIAKLNWMGYKTAVCYTANEAIKEIEEYLSCPSLKDINIIKQI